MELCTTKIDGYQPQHIDTNGFKSHMIEEQIYNLFNHQVEGSSKDIHQRPSRLCQSTIRQREEPLLPHSARHIQLIEANYRAVDCSH